MPSYEMTAILPAAMSDGQIDDLVLLAETLLPGHAFSFGLNPQTRITVIGQGAHGPTLINAFGLLLSSCDWEPVAMSYRLLVGDEDPLWETAA